MRLHDRILLGKWRDNFGAITEVERGLVVSQFIPIMQSAKVIVADNVAEYLLNNMKQYAIGIHKEGDSTVGVVNYNEYNMAPPFSNFMISIKVPSSTRCPFTEWVVWMSAYSQQELIKLRELKSTEPVDAALKALDEAEAKWYARWLLFVDVGDSEPPMLSAIGSNLINEKGVGNPKVYSLPGLQKRINVLAKAVLLEKDQEDAIELQGQLARMKEVPDIINTLNWAAHTAIMFMHCRNVEVVEHKPDAALSKRHQQRHSGPPLMRFHTIHIEPLKKILKKEGRVETTGIHRALHICRGHFKDYREHGLFGSDKHKGVYWWPAIVKGNAEHGVVASKYEVETNK